MSIRLIILVLTIFGFSNNILAENYPDFKSPIISIAGNIKKLKYPENLDIKDYTIKNSGLNIYINVNERTKKLKNLSEKKLLRQCLFSSSQLENSRSKINFDSSYIKPMKEIGGHSWKQDGNPINFINFAQPLIKNMNKRIRFFMASGDQMYLEYFKKQLLMWAKGNSFEILISDGYNKDWKSDFGYIDTLENIRQTLAPMLIAFDFLRQNKFLTDEEDKIIFKWFNKVIKKTSIGPNDGSKEKNGVPPGNHTEASKSRNYLLWSIISGDNDYFQAALKAYVVALNITRKDGSSSWEVRKEKGKSQRSVRALTKMSQVVGGMVMTAEIFANQGYDLYSFKTKKDVDLHKMIDFLITYYAYPESGAKKKSYVNPEKLDKSDLRKQKDTDYTLGYLNVYYNRFPNHPTAQKVKKYYLEPYGWKFTAMSSGYGLDLGCAYSNLEKLK